MGSTAIPSSLGTTVTGALATLSNTGSGMHVVWTNPNPTRDFSGQTINLTNGNNYTYFMIVSNGGSYPYQNSTICIKGGKSVLSASFPSNGGTGTAYTCWCVRFVNIANDGGTLTLGDCLSAYNGQTGNTKVNKAMIPYTVIGFNVS